MDVIFIFKLKTAYEMRISDWSSDVCSSDLTEPDFALVECFAPGNHCVITGCCRLPNVLNEALNSFVTTLDRYTLADLMLTERDFSAPRPLAEETRGPGIGRASCRERV